MKAQEASTVPLTVAAPMQFAFLPPWGDAVTRRVIGRIESRAVPRPETTLLRQHCALII